MKLQVLEQLRSNQQPLDRAAQENRQQTDSLSLDDIRRDLHNALSNKDLISARASLDRMPHDNRDHEATIARLAAENDVYATFEDVMPVDEKTNLQQQIKNEALELAVRALPVEDVEGLGLEERHFDDAGLNQPPTVREALLIGVSWDSTNKDPLVGELFVKMASRLQEFDADIVNASLQHALETNVSFKDSFQEVTAKIDDEIDADWGAAHQRVEDNKANLRN